MKTAMQEMFSQLEIDQPQLFNINTAEGKAFVNSYFKYIELEKQQIIDAYETAMETDIYNTPLKVGKQYYNETFKKQ
jgi:hypothetical protein